MSKSGLMILACVEPGLLSVEKKIEFFLFLFFYFQPVMNILPLMFSLFRQEEGLEPKLREIR
jgi:hypothetical protein